MDDVLYCGTLMPVFWPQPLYPVVAGLSGSFPHLPHPPYRPL